MIFTMLCYFALGSCVVFFDAQMRVHFCVCVNPDGYALGDKRMYYFIALGRVEIISVS